MSDGSITALDMVAAAKADLAAKRYHIIATRPQLVAAGAHTLEAAQLKRDLYEAEAIAEVGYSHMPYFIIKDTQA